MTFSSVCVCNRAGKMGTNMYLIMYAEQVMRIFMVAFMILTYIV